LGSQGAVLFSASEKIRIETPPVDVKSIVGAVDSMVAGMISVLVQEEITKKSFPSESLVDLPLQ